jgi:predicted nuclease of predicted toxin-antitoxin system
LVLLVASTYPECTHLESLGLLGATDRAVWKQAGEGGYVLVTKDADFHRLSILLGPPPKVVWLRIGNASPMEVAQALERSADAIRAFVEDPELGFLSID